MKVKYIILSAVVLGLVVGCKNDDSPTPDKTNNSLPDWYYAGGKLGTTTLATSNAFEQPTASVEAGFYESFKRGEALFEKQFMSNPTGTRGGLGPVYVRSSCIHCHPGYGHGKRIEAGTYNSTEIGNGTLLVIYNPITEAYCTWVAGMPQLHAVAPFKAPIDESQITIKWNTYTTGVFGNAFPDGEKFELVYPTVEMPTSAIYGYDQLKELGNDMNYAVKLENTIGIFGTGLTDAIPDDSITAQWAREEEAFNKGYLKHWKSEWFEGGTWKTYYTNSRQGDGTQYVRRYTYAMSRGPILDAAGANAIWNIPNVTRSDRRYHYLDLKGTNYATVASKDAEVQAAFPDYIKQYANATDNPEFFTDNVEQNIYNYLTSTKLPVEMTDEEYTDVMVWHRGLAVPAVRNINDSAVWKGKELFTKIGCAQCHRPSWTTGPDNLQDPNKFFKSEADMPHYAYQKIWPYSDFVQHKLCMVEDIRTGWCRTTPLWGRGLHQKCTGDETAARLHDTRARNVIEAIMWHAVSEESDAYESVKQFYNLSKTERDAIVAFVDAI